MTRQHGEGQLRERYAKERATVRTQLQALAFGEQAFRRRAPRERNRAWTTFFHCSQVAERFVKRRKNGTTHFPGHGQSLAFLLSSYFEGKVGARFFFTL